MISLAGAENGRLKYSDVCLSQAGRDQRFIVFGRETTRHGDVLKIVEI
jgi:hypothetical protein